MLNGKAYKALLSDGTDSDLIPRLRDPVLLEAFAALADDLRAVVGQIRRQNRKRHVNAQRYRRDPRARDCSSGSAGR
jgi:hypothetical protein